MRQARMPKWVIPMGAALMVVIAGGIGGWWWVARDGGAVIEPSSAPKLQEMAQPAAAVEIRCFG
jgi:hypothetical protein